MVWQTVQAWLAGFGMCPAGSAVEFQLAVVWQRLQSFGATICPAVWSAGRPCSAGLAAPM